MKKLKIILFLMILHSSLFSQNESGLYDNIGFYGVYQADWALIEKDDKIGFINKKGQVIVKPIFDTIGYFDDSAENLALVEINDKVAYINREGKIITK